MGDELTKFEGLLKKIQNHREIVNTFEIKIEELEQNASDINRPVIEQDQDHETEKVIYVKGVR